MLFEGIDKGEDETVMKHQKANKPLDEREKLRKFRELDDAFAQALKMLDDPAKSQDIPTGPPVRSLAMLEQEEQEAQAQRDQERFKERLNALISESGFSSKALAAIVNALTTHGVWQVDELPSPQ